VQVSDPSQKEPEMTASCLTQNSLTCNSKPNAHC